MDTVGTPILWFGFVALILVVLAIDLGAFRKKSSQELSLRQAAAWCAVWVSLAAIFNVWVYFRFGSATALEFMTGYLIEEALSVDNLFVFLAIFWYFNVPRRLQHRVLFFGILGALIMRGAFIGAGTALLHRFEWLTFVFGGFLVVTGLRLLKGGVEGVEDPGKSPVVRFFRRFVPMTDGYREDRFVVREAGRRLATPLLLVLVAIEVTDVVFALDSVPAVLAITRDPFIVYTSNVFAILGLRSLFFLLAGAMQQLRFLKYGLALVLVFVGVKMVGAEWFHISTAASLGVVSALLGASVTASLLVARRRGTPIVASPTSGEPATPPNGRHDGSADASKVRTYGDRP
jgi:tellurite resistance protein TerC